MYTDMSKYKMIYENKVYNCISMIMNYDTQDKSDAIITELQVFYINEDNKVLLIIADADDIQFVKS